MNVKPILSDKLKALEREVGRAARRTTRSE